MLQRVFSARISNFQLQELTALLRSMGQNPTDSEVHDMINEVDVDGSGVVEFEEFVQFIARYWNRIEIRIRIMFS